jgi:hypothetical protein
MYGKGPTFRDHLNLTFKPTGVVVANGLLYLAIAAVASINQSIFIVSDSYILESKYVSNKIKHRGMSKWRAG